jgi:hypothetical protein
MGEKLDACVDKVSEKASSAKAYVSGASTDAADQVRDKARD